MSNPTIDLLHELIEAGWLPPELGQGHKHAAMTEAARRLKVARHTLNGRLARLASKGITPDWSRYRPLEEAQSEPITAPPMAERPRIRVKAHTAYTPPAGPIYRILGIGDAHEKPSRDKSRFTWIGRHAAETKPDKIVSIGDFLSLDSLARHPPPGSERDASRPPFFEELESGEEALSLIDRECPEIEKLHTHGNHEARAWTAADMQPKLCGDMPVRVDQVFARYRWRTYEYRKPLYIGGVLFLHVPINVMGREYGGKHSENTINADSVFSTVWGHDHRYRIKTMYKIPDRRIELLNLGTAMPYGEIEDYNVGVTGWTWGIVDITIQGGQIISNKFHSMLELEQRYHD